MMLNNLCYVNLKFFNVDCDINLDGFDICNMVQLYKNLALSTRISDGLSSFRSDKLLTGISFSFLHQKLFTLKIAEIFLSRKILPKLM